MTDRVVPATAGAGSPSLPTGVGRALDGDNHYRGHSVRDDLLGSETVTGLVALALGSRRLGPEERAVLDDLAVIMTVADPRIWPLKLTRVVSAYGGALPALAASALCVDRARVGHLTTGAAAASLVRLADRVGVDPEPEQVRAVVRAMLSEQGRWMGFGVPFREHDERVGFLRASLRRHRRHDGRHVQLFERVAEVVAEEKGLHPNIGLAAGAALLDLGFAPSEIGLLAFALGQTDYLANAVEGAAQAPACLRELPPSVVVHRTPTPRVSPRAEARRAGG